MDERTAGPLEGRTAVVTGAGAGIGAAIARRLWADGARVLVTDVDGAGAVAVARALGPTAEAMTIDVTAEADVRAAVDRVVGWGGLDIWVGNAGLGIGGLITDVTLEDFERQFAVNVRGVFLGMKHAIAAMRETGGGAIVNIASTAAATGVPRLPIYSGTKGAIVAMSRTAAIDHGHEGIRINCVAPGAVDTPLVARVIAASPDPVAARAARAAPQMTGRLVAPEEVADAVAYLVGDGAASTTGSVLTIDGGRTAVWPMTGLPTRA